jgi:hypothetical protein
MKYISIFAMLLVILTSCAPSEKAIQEAIQKTQAVVDQTATAQAGKVQATEISITATSEAKVAATQAKQAEIAMTSTSEASVLATMNAGCNKSEVDEAYAQLGDIASRFAAKAKLALSTSRISLSPVVSDIQDLQLEAKKVAVPKCMEFTRAQLVVGIDEGVNAFLGFMSKESNDVINAHLEKSTNAVSAFVDEAKRIKACAPNCD